MQQDRKAQIYPDPTTIRVFILRQCDLKAKDSTLNREEGDWLLNVLSSSLMHFCEQSSDIAHVILAAH